MTLHNGFAFDRASVRSVDVDGRLHIDLTNISMEQVADYLGREIPGWEELGLDPAKVYKLFRPAEELEKAKDTFNLVPLLSRHVPVNVEEPRQDLVIGSTGTDAVFVAPYLKNSLVVWVAEAIENIESGKVKEISCAYRYKPVLKPGTFNGESYDIVMTNLEANHVALVAAGRAGPTVVVGDSLPQELQHMSKKAPPSRMALIARGALMAFLPTLAVDHKLDLASVTQGVTSKNWLERKPTILATVKPMLAQDADVGTLHKLLDGLDGEAKPGAVGSDDDAPPADSSTLSPGQTDASLDATDADPCADLMALLQGKLSPEDMQAFEAKLRAAMTPAAATDAEPAGPPATPGTPLIPTTKKEDDVISKPAMDAALAKTKTEAIAEGRKLARDIAEAEKVVKPYVGVLPAMDSAEEVYKSALELLGVKVEGVHPSAYRAVLEARPAPGSDAPRARTVAVAMDAQTEVTKQFPGVSRIRVTD